MIRFQVSGAVAALGVRQHMIPAANKNAAKAKFLRAYPGKRIAFQGVMTPEEVEKHQKAVLKRLDQKREAQRNDNAA